MRAPAAAALVLATAVLTGCGAAQGADSAQEKAAEQQVKAGGAPTPVCVAQARKANVPASFPAFPLPDGSVVYGSEQRSGARTIVYAVVDRDVKAVLKQIQRDAPAAGFSPTQGEVEERDAESNWHGNGYTGRRAIREVAACPDQTSVTVLAAKR
jgi:hypothetical protein